MASQTIEQIVNHLEFLGYEVSSDENITKARHSSRANMLLKDYNGMVLFTAIFGVEDAAKTDRVGYFEFINSMNRGAMVARTYADADSDLFFEACFPGSYEKGAFARFIESWHHDTDQQLSQKASEASKYLR